MFLERYKMVQKSNGQVTIEYMLVLSAVAIVVLLGFKSYFPKVQGGAELYFNRVSDGIMDDPPACGNGICEPGRLENQTTCCFDCGGCGFDGSALIP